MNRRHCQLSSYTQSPDLQVLIRNKGEAESVAAQDGVAYVLKQGWRAGQLCERKEGNHNCKGLNDN